MALSMLFLCNKTHKGPTLNPGCIKPYVFIGKILNPARPQLGGFLLLKDILKTRQRQAKARLKQGMKIERT